MDILRWSAISVGLGLIFAWLFSRVGMLQADPDSAALRTLAATIPPMVASLEMFRIGFAGDSPVCGLPTSRKALYMLANEVQTLANMP